MNIDFNIEVVFSYSYRTNAHIGFSAEDDVDPVEEALMMFARTGRSSARSSDPVVEETLLRLVPTCQPTPTPTPRSPSGVSRAQFERDEFDRQIRDQLCGLLVDYLQSDPRVQLALRRFRKLTSANSSHLSGARSSELLLLHAYRSPIP